MHTKSSCSSSNVALSQFNMIRILPGDWHTCILCTTSAQNDESIQVTFCKHYASIQTFAHLHIACCILVVVTVIVVVRACMPLIQIVLSIVVFFFATSLV